MATLLICQKDKLAKLKKKKLSRRKLMTSLKDTLSKVILTLLLLSVHVPPKFISTTKFLFVSLKQKFF